ncbi:MAG: hypothetical protein Kow00109_02830 [Acidobacteriota bacterium]
MGRKTSAERRKQIARTALDLIAGQGIKSCTTARLAAAVGVSSGALFRHFPSLDGILLEAVRYALSRIEQTFPPPNLPPLERILRLVADRIRLFRAEPGIAWVLRSDQALLVLPEEALREVRAMMERSKAYLLEALREGVRERSIRSEPAPEVLLVFIAGVIHTLGASGGPHREAIQGLTRRDDQVLETLRAFLAAEVSAVPGTPATRREESDSVSQKETRRRHQDGN